MNCKILNCDRIVHRRGWCSIHYRRGLRSGAIKRIPKQGKCNFCGKQAFARNLCGRHYQQLSSGGVRRTGRDFNEIVYYSDYAEVILYKQGLEVARTKIDLEDVKKVKTKKIQLESNGYAIFTDAGKQIKLHQFLFVTSEETIDHINRNRLDNRKKNLRGCSHSLNAFNIAIPSHNKSGVVGVCWLCRDKRWFAFIRYKKKLIRLGTFKKKICAVRARKRAELKYYGEVVNR